MLKKIFSITSIGFAVFTVSQILCLFNLINHPLMHKLIDFGFSFFLGAHIVMFIILHSKEAEDKQ